MLATDVGGLPTWVGVLDTRIRALGTRGGVLDTCEDMLDTRVGVLATRDYLLDARVGGLVCWTNVLCALNKHFGVLYTQVGRARHMCWWCVGHAW
jgi:hypothetical protein